MNEYETRPDDGPALGTALADLAASMPDDPFRIDGVHARARRLRQRRRAVRATAGAAVAAAVVATLVAVRPGATSVSTVPASQPTTLVVPSCTAALASAPPAPTVDPATASPDAAAADEKKAAAVAAEQHATAGAAQSGADFRGVKGLGAIVSATDATVTITPDEPVAGQTEPITAAISPSAEFVDGATKVEARPTLAPGDRVGFAVSVADDGGYDLVFLTVHVPEAPGTTPDTVAPEVKAAQDRVTDGTYAKVIATVVSVQPGSLALDVTDGDLVLGTVTVATGPATTYTAGDQPCVDPQLAPGQVIGAVLVRADDGTYTAERLALYAAS